MGKLISFVVLAILLNLTCPAGAECWRWTTNGKPADMDYGFRSLFWMAFDKQRGQPSILFRKDYSYDLELLHYDGRTWQKSWEGYITPPSGFFAGPIGLYFDRNQNTLILIAGIIYDFEIGSLAAFKYVKGQGWIYIAETGNCYIFGYDVLPVYDTKRARAVLILSYCSEGYFFVEFDGFQFHYIEINRNDFAFDAGVAGYNADTGNVVFFGHNRSSLTWEAESYEYDGSSWAKIET